MNKLSDLVGTNACSKLRWFEWSAGTILGLVGMAKILSVLSDSKALLQVDPIIGVKFSVLLAIVGTVELVIAALCLVCRSQRLVIASVAWISTIFILYRFGLWLLDWRQPCQCLGTLTKGLHISPLFADNFMKLVLAYLFIGSCGLLIRQSQQCTVSQV